MMTGLSPRGPSEGPRLELLLDAISDYAIFMMDLDGFITTWNAGAGTTHGYSQADIIGQHFSRFFSSADRAARLPEKIIEIARALGRHESEGWRLRKDGSRFWCDAIVQLVNDQDGSPIGFANVNRDFTEKMMAQEALLEFGAAVPAAGGRGRRLRDLHARPERRRHQLEHWRSTPEGLQVERDHRPSFLRLLPPGGPRNGPAGARS